MMKKKIAASFVVAVSFLGILALQSCSSKGGGGSETEMATALSKVSCPNGMGGLPDDCCNAKGEIISQEASCNSVFTPGQDNTQAAVQAAKAAASSLGVADDLKSDSATAEQSAAIADPSAPIASNNDDANPVIDPSQDGTPQSASMGSDDRAASASNGGGASGSGNASSSVGNTETHAAVADLGPASAGPSSLGAMGAGGGARVPAGSSGFNMASDFGNNNAGGGHAVAEMSGPKSGAFTGVMASADPEDYFTLTSAKDDLFKVIQRRYQKTSMSWAAGAKTR